MNKLPIFKNISYLKSSNGEDEIANNVAIELRCLSLEGKLSGIWFHVPNENVVKNKLDIIRLKKKQSIGMINGVADFAFIKHDKNLLIELKTPKGKLSESQKLFQAWCKEESITYRIARSWNDVKFLLQEFKFLGVACR